MTPNQKRTLTAVLCILSNLLIVLAIALALTGCGQEEQQPIIVNVTAPEPEPPAVEPEPIPAEPEPSAEPAPEPNPDDVVTGIIVKAKHRMRDALAAWNEEKQGQGNDRYMEAVELLFSLHEEHGWTLDAVKAEIKDIIDTAMKAYADDVDAILRILDGLQAFAEEHL